MNFHDKPPSYIDLESVHPLSRSSRRNKRRKEEDERRSVEEITSLSADTIKREHADKVVHLSERRLGMKLRHALAIAGGLVGRE